MGVTDRYLEALDDIQKAVESREKSWRSGGHPQPGEARPPGAASTIAGADLKAAECSAILVVIENLRYQHAGVPPLTGVNSWGSAGSELSVSAQVGPKEKSGITTAYLEKWLTKLEVRVAAVEHRLIDAEHLADRVVTVTPEVPLDVEPLRRLAAWAEESVSGGFYRQQILDALREAGVIQQEEVPHG